jgi:hypothetical protein
MQKLMSEMENSAAFVKKFNLNDFEVEPIDFRFQTFKIQQHTGTTSCVHEIIKEHSKTHFCYHIPNFLNSLMSQLSLMMVDIPFPFFMSVFNVWFLLYYHFMNVNK